MSSESIDDVPSERVEFVYRGGGEIPASVTHLRVDSSVTHIPEGAFEGLQHYLVEVDLPEGLIEIGDNAFAACESLARINFPSTLLKIGRGAFYRCAGLTDVRLPDGLVEIGPAAFMECKLLESVRIPSGVQIIPQNCFRNSRLRDVELPEGVIEIKDLAFHYCGSLESISIPSSVRLIREWAFCGCRKLSSTLLLPGGLEEIGKQAFYHCEAIQQVTFSSALNGEGISLTVGEEAFSGCYDMAVMDFPDSVQSFGRYALCSSTIQSFRCPPQVGTFDLSMLSVLRNNTSLVSVELPETLNELRGSVPSVNLRNIAIPPNCRDGLPSDEKSDLFWNVELVSKGRLDKSQVDLCKAFPSSNSAQIAVALEKRFDGLPVHKLCYYQSYEGGGALEELKRLCPARKLRSSGAIPLQDVLGMTPLHILACSAKQNIQLYPVLLDAHPEMLSMEDKWGDIPLLYAFWSNAPTEVVCMLAESHKKICPSFALNWTKMLVTLGRANASVATMKNLIETHQTHFPDDELYLSSGIAELAGLGTLLKARMRFLLELDTSRRVAATKVESWRVGIENMVKVCLGKSVKSPHADFLKEGEGSEELSAVYATLTLCEQLKEASSLVELALWKYKLILALPQVAEERPTKRARIGSAAERERCRITCGADAVVPHVLSYLLPSFE